MGIKQLGSALRLHIDVDIGADGRRLAFWQSINIIACCEHGRFCLYRNPIHYPKGGVALRDALEQHISIGLHIGDKTLPMLDTQSRQTVWVWH